MQTSPLTSPERVDTQDRCILKMTHSFKLFPGFFFYLERVPKLIGDPTYQWIQIVFILLKDYIKSIYKLNRDILTPFPII